MSLRMFFTTDCVTRVLRHSCCAEQQPHALVHNGQPIYTLFQLPENAKGIILLFISTLSHKRTPATA